MKILKCLLMIVTAPVVLVLTLFVWLCTGLIYISGLVLGLLSTVIEMCIRDRTVVDGVNPGLTDLFTRQARKTMQEQQKSSVLQKLKQEPPAHKPVAPKNQEPER